MKEFATRMKQLLELLEAMASETFKESDSQDGESYLEGRLHAYTELRLILRMVEEGLL